MNKIIAVIFGDVEINSSGGFDIGRNGQFNCKR